MSLPSRTTLWAAGGIATGALLYWMLSGKRKKDIVVKKEVEVIPVEAESYSATGEDVETWIVNESETVMRLVVAISEDQASRGTE
jgi:hypothetical protein